MTNPTLIKNQNQSGNGKAKGGKPKTTQGGRGRGKQQAGRGRGGNASNANSKGNKQAAEPKEKKDKQQKDAEPPPVECPDPPSIVDVVGGAEQATVSFKAPAYDGNAPISNFIVTASPGDIVAEVAASPAVVTGLQSGIKYTFVVAAVNEAGSSVASVVSQPLILKPTVIVHLFEGSDEEQKAAAQSIVAVFKASGLNSAEFKELFEAIVAVGASTDATKKAYFGFTLVFAAFLAEPTAESITLALYPHTMERLGDKFKPSRMSAEESIVTLRDTLVSEHTARYLLPATIKCVDSYAWQAKVAAIATLSVMADKAPVATAAYLESIVPAVTQAMGNTKKAVANAATECMSVVCNQIDNRDVKPFIPALVSSMARPREVPEAIQALAGTTFVQSVDVAVLSVMVPVLQRGLREGTTAVKRQTCVIIDNMSKLVEDAYDVRVFMPKLLPGVERASKEISDPEARSIAERCLVTLTRVQKESEAASNTRIDNDDDILALIKETVTIPESSVTTSSALAQAVSVAASMCACNQLEVSAWETTFVPRLAVLIGEEAAKSAVTPVVTKLKALKEKAEQIDDDDTEGVDLCNCEFSLAYGSKILLNNARLRLKLGRRYGLVGPNGVGKSTLMRSIVEGQLDGFPPKEELRTVYVECDISPDLAELNVTEFVMADPMLSECTKEEVAETLTKVEFTQQMQVDPVSSLSGGWRMKLALARAMLKNAQILLLDEPTNHLDVGNVQWVVDYLCSLTDVTSIIVSHDSGFLDKSCTDIIHFNYLKLKNYRGNLSHFVSLVPEAKAYYELKSETLTFTFPDPAFLEGVKSRGKAILKMAGCGFTYPNTTRKILTDINIHVSMASRCAVVGPNGAGKSTMIKLLTGELVPDEGTVWKHPNLVLAYVAQHAFHHIENHIQSTPNEYIRWRFQGGEDKEGLNRLANEPTEEELKKMAEPIKMEAGKQVIYKILSRRKGKRGDEYEVSFVGKAPSSNMWMSRDKLTKLGWEKLCRRMDLKVAAQSGGSLQRTLSIAEVEKHLACLGLEAEFATHTRIDSLSTSQKVKVVLAAATWNNPHIIVLDEPTNYLDRESLGALAQAIRDYKGGVVMISHNSEFTGALCPETWHMKGGHLHAEGGVDEAMDVALDTEEKLEGEDARGNKFKVKAKKKEMSRKERKAWQKRRAAKIRNGEPLSSDDEEEDF